jgi:hypothetical protein
MAEHLLTILNNIGDAVYQAFMLPGEFLLSRFVAIAPVSAERFGIAGEMAGTKLPVVLSSLSWILLFVALWMFLWLLRSTARIAGTTIRVFYFRIYTAVCSFKTKLILKVRELLPQRKPAELSPIPMVEFDDLDLAVLRSASARGPGFALSAPELADEFTMRPSQIQCSLDKLSRNKMLDHVIGSTDGFDNYRLTDAGAAFVAMWKRRGTVADVAPRRQMA